MKQAILILVHKDFEQICRLINYFQGKCDIFLHIDPNSSFTSGEIEYLREMDGVVKLYQKYRVNWGGFRLLQIELFMLKKALKYSDFKYIHLVSGQDYPLKPLNHFLDVFDNSEEDYLGCFHMPSPKMDQNTFRRLQYYFFYDWVKATSEEDIRKMWKFTYFQQKLGIRREVFKQFEHLYCGSAWFSLTRRGVAKLVEYTYKKPSFYRRMRFTFVPEEIYISTVLMNLDYENKKMGGKNYRFVNWPYQGANHPAILNEDDLIKLACTDAMFARKVEMHESAKLLDIIDKYLLPVPINIRHENGILEHNTLFGYFFDRNLSESIVNISKLLNIKDVIDLGCAPGYYVADFRRSGIIARGFDGNPYINELSQLILKSKFPCERINLHEPIKQKNMSDMVMLLNVGEYIPKHYQETLLENVCGLARKYLIISWQGEAGKFNKDIVNPISKEELENAVGKYGYELDAVTSAILQESSLLDMHKKNTYFFRRC